MESRFQKGLLLFWYFLKGMSFAFTGGMVAMPMIEKDIVDRKHWMTKEEFWSYPPIGQTLPGVISVHNSIMIGNHIAGWPGALGAVLGVITPAFGSMFLVSVLFTALVNNPYVFGAIRGIRAISVALMFSTSISLAQNCDRTLLTGVIIVLSLCLRLFFGVSAFVTILLCGAVGIVNVYAEKEKAQ